MQIANKLKLVTGTALLLLALSAANSQEMAHAMLKDKRARMSAMWN